MSNSSCDCENIANAFAKDHLATHDWRNDLEAPVYRVVHGTAVSSANQTSAWLRRP
jgi:hypothetical protein